MDDVTIHIEELILNNASATPVENLRQAIRDQAPGLTNAQLTAVAQAIKQSLPPTPRGDQPEDRAG